MQSSADCSKKSDFSSGTQPVRNDQTQFISTHSSVFLNQNSTIISGLKLSQIVRDAIVQFTAKLNATPRVILLENHGIIALGSSPAAVKAALYMADKAARISRSAIAAGGPRFLEADQWSASPIASTSTIASACCNYDRRSHECRHFVRDLH